MLTRICINTFRKGAPEKARYVDGVRSGSISASAVRIPTNISDKRCIKSRLKSSTVNAIEIRQHIKCARFLATFNMYKEHSINLLGFDLTTRLLTLGGLRAG